MKTGVIIQARLGSTRLPRKVLADINGHPMLWHVYNRARQIEGIDIVIISIPRLDSDIRNLVRSWGVALYQGSPDDVLDRYYNTAKLYNLDTIIRVTADCPLLDPQVGTDVLRVFNQGKWDYVSNVHPPTYPDGLDVEVMNMYALERSWKLAKEPWQREHVSPYVWERPSPFSLQNVWADADYSKHRWTVDTFEDLEWVRGVYRKLGDNFRWREVLDIDPPRTLTREIRL